MLIFGQQHIFCMHNDFPPDKPDFMKQAVRMMAKDDVARRYGDGERDFSGMVSPNSDFSGMNLAGIIMRRAKLGHSSFKNCNLCGADFSGAKKESSFKGRVMTAAEIINEYKGGRKDFSGVSVPNSDFSGCDISKANVAWSLTIKTNFSDKQFFSFSPDVLETLKLASPVIGSTSRTALKTHSSEPYSANKRIGEYVKAGENVLVYGEHGFEVASVYSPNEKKHMGEYKA